MARLPANRDASQERDRSSVASIGRSAARSGTEGNLAIAAVLALLDAAHHALTVDVTDSEVARFGATQAGAIECQEQCAVTEILRARDETLVGTEDDRQAEPLLRVRQALAHVGPLRHLAAEEPEGADLRDHGPDGAPSLLQEEDRHDRNAST